jgi:hypothetical protein
MVRARSTLIAVFAGALVFCAAVGAFIAIQGRL